MGSLEELLVDMGVGPTMIRTHFPEREEQYFVCLRTAYPHLSYKYIINRMLELHEEEEKSGRADPLRPFLTDAKDKRRLYLRELALVREEAVKKNLKEAYKMFRHTNDEIGLKLARVKLIETNPDIALDTFSGDIEGLSLLGQTVIETHPAVAYLALAWGAKCNDSELLSKAKRNMIEKEPKNALNYLSTTDKEGLSAVGRKLIDIDVWDAYKALIAAEDEAELSSVREKMMNENLKEALSSFDRYKDKKGMGLAGQRLIPVKPKSAYELLVKIGDKTGIKAARAELLLKDPDEAYKSISENHIDDPEGVVLISQRLIDTDLEQALLILGRVGYEKGLTQALKKLSETDPERAYAYSVSRGYSEMRIGNLKRLMEENPAKAYLTAKGCRDDDGIQRVINFIVKEYGVDADKIKKALKILPPQKHCESESVRYDYDNRARVFLGIV